MITLREMKLPNGQQAARSESIHQTLLKEIRKQETNDNPQPGLESGQGSAKVTSPTDKTFNKKGSETGRNRGREKEREPVENAELELLVHREDHIRRLIDYNLSGFCILYFTRIRQGSISEVRGLLERQIQLGRVVKGLDFIGDEENEVTEVVTLAKNAKAFITANTKILQRRRIIGEYLQDHNPYHPKWDPSIKMTPQQRQTRTAGHIRKMVTQWQNCATKSKNEDIKRLYTERLEQVEGQDKEFWMHLVHNMSRQDCHRPIACGSTKGVHKRARGAKSKRAEAAREGQ